MKIKNIKTIFSKKVLKIIFIISSFLFLIISPFYVFDKSRYSLDLNNLFTQDKSSKVVLNIFHIETFEGGTNSRSKYLEEIALNFNKSNKNCFIVIKTLTPEQLILNLQENNIPDLFSFGVGVGEYLKGFLTELDNNLNIRSDLIEYGKLEDKIYAYPYILSGYCLISYSEFIESSSSDLNSLITNKVKDKKEFSGLSIQKGGYTLPISVLVKNNINLVKDNYLTFSSGYETYINFISKNSVTLLGTARDLARCKNRESMGNINSLQYNFLGGYSDLIQYIGVVDTKNSIKMIYAKNFAKYLTSQTSQNCLNNFGLFSVNNLFIYENDYMSLFEKTLKEDLYSLNAFISKDELITLENSYFSKTV